MVLPCILRREVLKAAQALGLATVERKITAGELAAADEVFLTNALIDILPVSGIENCPISQGTVTHTLLDRLHVQPE